MESSLMVETRHNDFDLFKDIISISWSPEKLGNVDIYRIGERENGINTFLHIFSRWTQKPFTKVSFQEELKIWIKTYQ